MTEKELREALTAAMRAKDTARLRATFGLTLAPWQDGVERLLAEIL